MLETLQSLQPKAILVNKGHFIALRLGYLQDFLMISSFKIVPQGGDACKICEQCFFKKITRKKAVKNLTLNHFYLEILKYKLYLEFMVWNLFVHFRNKTSLHCCLNWVFISSFFTYLLFAEMRSFPGIFDWERMLSRWPHSSSTTLPVKS